MYWRRRLTRLELALYAVVVSIMLIAFFERALYYMELSERAAMETTILNLNAGLAVRSAFASLSGRPVQTEGNPFELAGAPSPVNFGGVVRAADPGELPRGLWFFDPDRRELVYLPRLQRGLTVDAPGSLLRFKLDHTRHPLKLVPTITYAWK